jgi:hypothetical protein
MQHGRTPHTRGPSRGGVRDLDLLLGWRGEEGTRGRAGVGGALGVCVCVCSLGLVGGRGSCGRRGAPSCSPAPTPPPPAPAVARRRRAVPRGVGTAALVARHLLLFGLGARGGGGRRGTRRRAGAARRRRRGAVSARAKVEAAGGERFACCKATPLPGGVAHGLRCCRTGCAALGGRTPGAPPAIVAGRQHRHAPACEVAPL